MTTTETFAPTDRATLLAWLAGMDPMTRARVAGLLVDQPTIEAVGAARREAVSQASKATSRSQVAAALGVSLSAVHKACQTHDRAVNREASES